MVFQHFALLPWADVIDNVSFGLKLAGVSKSERERQARYFVELVGLSGSEHAHPRELSGACSSVSGWRALAVDPAFLLLDEPFGALDEITRRHAERVIRIWERSRKTALS